MYNISIINERGNNNMFGQPLPKVKLTPKFSLFLNDDNKSSKDKVSNFIIFSI